MERKELEEKSRWFECQGNERLQHQSVADAVLALYDEISDDEVQRWRDAQVAVTVDCFAPREWTQDDITRYADAIVEGACDMFYNDEDFGGEDPPEFTEKVGVLLQAKALEFVELFAKHTKPYWCRLLGQIVLTPAEVAEIVKNYENT